MKENVNLSIRMLALIALIFIVILLLRTIKALKVERRINNYALLSLDETEDSFFDLFYRKSLYFISMLSVSLYKIKFFRKQAIKFEKYIVFEERDIKSGVDYIALKIILATIATLFTLFIILMEQIAFGPLYVLLTFIIFYFIPNILLSIKFANKKIHIENDLLKAIMIMNNAFKGGKNIFKAIEAVKDEMEGPIADEFKKIYRDISFGLSIENAFNRFYERIEITDALYIASALTLLNKTGGNIVKVFSNIEKNIYNRKKLRDELKSMTAASMLIYRILLLMPLTMTISIVVLNPAFFKPMYTTLLGGFVILSVISLYLIYIVLVKKIMRIEI